MTKAARARTPYENHLVRQGQIFEQFIERIALPARQVAAQPDDYPKPPDLIAELRQCAGELDEAARIIEPGYPGVATLYTTAARRVRATIERAKEAGLA